MKKKIQSILVPIIVLAIAFWGFKKLSSSKQPPKKKSTKSVTAVLVEKALNSTIPVEIEATGALVAKNRSVLYSEVTGIFLPTSKAFKPGVPYSKGQALIRINNSEYAASVKAQRISFKSLILSTLADIQFDYPSELDAWKTYANGLSADKSLPELPKVDNENFSYYLTGKSIFSTYHFIKNLETRLAKYTITAPYSGVLVAADATPGSLVSPGQKLGEFIQPGLFELELSVNASLSDFLQIGKKVKLKNVGHTETYEGRVVRINSQIDRASQTITLYVQVQDKRLTEGQYLEAKIEAGTVDNVVEIGRNLLIDQAYVYLVEDGKLTQQKVDVIHSTQSTLLVRGIPDGSQMISRPVAGGFVGMSVEVRNQE